MRPRLSFLLVPALLVMLPVLAACSGRDDADPTPAATQGSASPSSTSAPSTTASPAASAAPTGSATARPTAAVTATPGSSAGVTVQPFPQRRADGKRQEDACGPYTVIREDTLGVQGVPTASSVKVVNSSGASIFSVETAQAGTSVGVDWCFDIDADGAPELSVFSYSGGAHCCIEQQVVTLQATSSTAVLTYPAGNANPLAPRDLDGKMPLELVGIDDRFAYFQNLPFAATPFVLVVYGKQGAEWVDITAEPAARTVVTQYRSQLVSQLSACDAVEASLKEICQKGLMTGVMVESLVLGDWEAFQFTLNIPDSVRAWLNGVRPQAEALMKIDKYDIN